MAVTEEIREKLQAKFAPATLNVVDESEEHIGHAGYQDGGESHFHVTISAPVFGSMSRISRHRAVHNALGADLVSRIHALGLTIGC